MRQRDGTKSAIVSSPPAVEPTNALLNSSLGGKPRAASYHDLERDT